MNLIALVLAISMANGDVQDVVLGMYYTQAECERAAIEQNVHGECYPVERIIRADEQPAANY